MIADRAEGGGTAQPIIVVSDRHLHQIASDAWQVLLDSNQPPWLFRHGGYIAEIGRDDDARPIIVHLDDAALRGRLDRLATWVSRKGRDQLHAARPPKDVVEDLLALEKPLPVLRGLTGTPVFASDGTLVSAPGYHEATRLFYEPLGDPIPHVRLAPSSADLERAKKLLFEEWLVDFPYVDEASRVNTAAAALTPIVREMISGPTPLFVIESPAPGTGKGLLAKSVGRIVFGREPSVMTEGRGEEEIRKRITAVLRDGVPVILIDNVKRRLDSAALAAVLTTTDWVDRVLGKSETIRLPNRGLWLVTGNNVELDGEIVRRAVSIRLDAQVDRPWERGAFRHDPFLPWVADHRHELVWALLVLAGHWVAQGQPSWVGKALGSFEDWCRVVGGILGAGGIKGFLENREELYRRADAETEEWRDFLACWWDTHVDAPVKTGELYDLAREWDLLPSVSGAARDDASERALRTKLGKALALRRDRRFGKYFIRHVGRDGHQKGALYRLEEARDESLPAEHQVPETPCSADVPQDNESSLDSAAEGAGHAEPVFNADREEKTTNRREEGTPIEVPQLPHVPQTDSEWADPVAEDWRNMPAFVSDVPRCNGCGGPLSVLVRSGLCGRCRQWGVVPEWAAFVARRTRA